MSGPTVQILTDTDGKQFEYREVKMFPGQQIKFNVRGPSKVIFQRLRGNVVGVALGDADPEPAIVSRQPQIIIPEGVQI